MRSLVKPSRGVKKIPLKYTRIGKKFGPQILTRGELAEILGSCSDSPLGRKAKCGLGILYFSGCRVSSLVKLVEHDIDLDAGLIRFQGKRGVFYTTGLPAALRDVLLPWLETRRQLGIGADRNVWCSLDGRSQTTASMRSLLRRIRAKCRISKPLRAHSARHRFVTECVSQSVNTAQICQALGNSSLQATYWQISRLTAPSAVSRLVF